MKDRRGRGGGNAASGQWVSTMPVSGCGVGGLEDAGFLFGSFAEGHFLSVIRKDKNGQSPIPFTPYPFYLSHLTSALHTWSDKT